MKVSTGGVAIVGASLLAYLPVLVAGGFTGDDFVHVAYGREVASLDRLPGALASPFLGAVPTYFRPVTVLDLAIEGSAFGTRPRPYYAAGVLLPAAAALAVAAAARAVARRLRFDPNAQRRAGTIAGLCFALSPTHVEAIAYIAARSDLLATLFGAGAVGAWLRARERGTVPLGALALQALAHGCKESAWTLPASIAFLELLLPPNEAGPRSRWRRGACALAWTTIPLAAYFGARALALEPGRALPRPPQLEAVSILGPGALAVAAEVVLSRLRLFLFAAHASVFGGAFRILLECIALAGVLGALSRRPLAPRIRALLAGAALALVFQGPGLLVHVDARDLSMTRQIYLPSVAVALALGALLARARPAAASAVAVLLPFAVATLGNQRPFLDATRASEAMRDAVAQARARYPEGGDVIYAIDVPFHLDGVPFFVAPFGTPRAFRAPFFDPPTEVQPIEGRALLLLRDALPEEAWRLEAGIRAVRFRRDEVRFTVHSARSGRPRTLSFGEEELRKWDSSRLAGGGTRLRSPRIDVNPLEHRTLLLDAPSLPKGALARWTRRGDATASGEASLRPDPRKEGSSRALLSARLDWFLAGPIETLELEIPAPATPPTAMRLEAERDGIELLEPAAGVRWNDATRGDFAFRSPYPGPHRLVFFVAPPVAVLEAPLAAGSRRETEWRIAARDLPHAAREVFDLVAPRALRAGWKVEVLDLDDPSFVVAESGARYFARPVPR